MEEPNLIETQDIIIKNKLNYSIFFNKILNDYDSGALYLVDNSNNNITINLPPIQNGLYFELSLLKIQIILYNLQIHKIQLIIQKLLARLAIS